jgi:hypothetical protein
LVAGGIAFAILIFVPLFVAEGGTVAAVCMMVGRVVSGTVAVTGALVIGAVTQSIVITKVVGVTFNPWVSDRFSPAPVGLAVAFAVTGNIGVPVGSVVPVTVANAGRPVVLAVFAAVVPPLFVETLMFSPLLPVVPVVIIVPTPYILAKTNAAEPQQQRCAPKYSPYSPKHVALRSDQVARRENTSDEVLLWSEKRSAAAAAR